MKVYRTAAVAKICGIHPNTVRLYETIGFMTPPEREKNGYRIFTDLHVAQIQLVRTALAVPVVQNGLRKLAVRVVQTAATRDFAEASRLAQQYLDLVESERQNAEDAIVITRELLRNQTPDMPEEYLTRSEAAKRLHISMDALRNWEMNGLLSVKRKKNGYRVYDGEDLRKLKIIRALRCASYSLAAILRLVNALHENPDTDIRLKINTPEEGEDILSVCDNLLTSLREARRNARRMVIQTRAMQKHFSANPPL